jgi:hypothetical protein
MSFSANVSDKSPADAKAEIRRQRESYGQNNISADEFDGAIPAIEAEIDRLAASVGEPCLVSVSASGHASHDYKGTKTPHEKMHEQTSIAVSVKKVQASA